MKSFGLALCQPLSKSFQNQGYALNSYKNSIQRSNRLFSGLPQQDRLNASPPQPQAPIMNKEEPAKAPAPSQRVYGGLKTLTESLPIFMVNTILDLRELRREETGIELKISLTREEIGLSTR